MILPTLPVWGRVWFCLLYLFLLLFDIDIYARLHCWCMYLFKRYMWLGSSLLVFFPTWRTNIFKLLQTKCLGLRIWVTTMLVEVTSCYIPSPNIFICIGNNFFGIHHGGGSFAKLIVYGTEEFLYEKKKLHPLSSNKVQNRMEETWSQFFLKWFWYGSVGIGLSKFQDLCWKHWV